MSLCESTKLKVKQKTICFQIGVQRESAPAAHKILGCLNEFAAKAIVQAVEISTLDYCNYLFYGASSKNLNCLQKLQNSATCFVSGAARRDTITLVLERLHWLPLRQRVEY